MTGFSDKSFQRSESFPVAGLLAVAGGLLDAYSYLSRGGVFANAQTGNIVLLALRLAEGRWWEAAAYLIPILAFVLGVLAAELIRTYHRHNGRLYHWRHTALLAEIVVVMVVAFLPLGRWDFVANATVSFVCAVQVGAFRKVRGNAFASTMCTGNLRSGTEALYYGVAAKRTEEVGKGLCYYAVIGCFMGGAALGGILTRLSPQYAVLGAAAFQLAAFLGMCEWTRRA